MEQLWYKTKIYKTLKLNFCNCLTEGYVDKG